MSALIEEKRPKKVKVRYDLPVHIHEKIIRYQRKLQFEQNPRITQVDALIDIIEKLTV